MEQDGGDREMEKRRKRWTLTLSCRFCIGMVALFFMYIVLVNIHTANKNDMEQTIF